MSLEGRDISLGIQSHSSWSGLPTCDLHLCAPQAPVGEQRAGLCNTSLRAEVHQCATERQINIPAVLTHECGLMIGLHSHFS